MHTYTQKQLLFVVSRAHRASQRQMLNQWIGRVRPQPDRSCLRYVLSSPQWTCLISCWTLSCSPAPPPHFLDCSPDSTQTAVRCAPFPVPAMNYFSLPSKDNSLPSFSPFADFPSPLSSYVPHKTPSRRVKLSRLQSILTSVSCSEGCSSHRV